MKTSRSTPVSTSRRRMLQLSALTTTGLICGGALASQTSPSEKLNIAVVGVAGRGQANLRGVAHENIVALCDVDQARMQPAAEQFPKARRFADFRRLFDAMHQEIDAVVVSTPDHTHAVVAVPAMQLGKHCYCEKPLAHNVEEVRVMTETARAQKVVTQMGTQIHAGDNYRRAVELVRSGALGQIKDVYVWLSADFDGPQRPRGVEQPDAPKEGMPVPESLDWDLWLGPAPKRPYHEAYCPFQWRYWWAFANGQLGDFFCHYCDLPFWALDLSHPLTVECEGALHPESTAKWAVAVQQYPARGEMPPVTLSWHNGGAWPSIVKERDVPRWRNGVLFVGDDGMLLADYNRHVLLPEARFADFERPAPSIPSSVGHHQEWIDACKNGTPTTCHFGYSGPLAEADLLCNVALRTGEKLTWDAAAMKATGCPAADEYLRRDYRDGWSL